MDRRLVNYIRNFGAGSFVAIFEFFSSFRNGNLMTDNTIKVELLSDKALALLLQLEQLNILRLVRSGDMEEKPKRQWAGSISKETASELLVSLDQSREEWERNI